MKKILCEIEGQQLMLPVLNTMYGSFRMVDFKGSPLFVKKKGKVFVSDK